MEETWLRTNVIWLETICGWSSVWSRQSWARLQARPPLLTSQDQSGAGAGQRLKFMELGTSRLRVRRGAGINSASHSLSQAGCGHQTLTGDVVTMLHYTSQLSCFEINNVVRWTTKAKPLYNPYKQSLDRNTQLTSVIGTELKLTEPVQNFSMDTFLQIPYNNILSVEFTLATDITSIVQKRNKYTVKY